VRLFAAANPPRLWFQELVFDLKPAVHGDGHALHEHASLNAIA
jgi:hypothetical protein